MQTQNNNFWRHVDENRRLGVVALTAVAGEAGKVLPTTVSCCAHTYTAFVRVYLLHSLTIPCAPSWHGRVNGVQESCCDPNRDSHVHPCGHRLLAVAAVAETRVVLCCAAAVLRTSSAAILSQMIAHQTRQHGGRVMEGMLDQY